MFANGSTGLIFGGKSSKLFAGSRFGQVAGLSALCAVRS
jgi:hypothetical protein